MSNFQKKNFNPKKHQIFKPINFQKYDGKTYPICRSSWEFSFCKWLDGNKKVLQWSSESLFIPYKDPSNQIIKGRIKTRRYYPDFLVKIDTNQGIVTWLVEIKPYKETIPPKQTVKKSTKTILYEAKTWKTNTAKWRAAQIYCKKRGWVFKILTEKDLF